MFKKAILNLTFIAMSVAFISVCAQIQIPLTISITLQILGIFLISGCFSPAIAIPSVLAYLALGIIGVPVFAGFRSGIDTIAGPSGGFLVSFVVCALIISIFHKKYPKKLYLYLITMLVALAFSYVFGSLWFSYIYVPKEGATFTKALMVCVVPFIIPDILKIGVVLLIYKKLHPFIRRLNV